MKCKYMNSMVLFLVILYLICYLNSTKLKSRMKSKFKNRFRNFNNTEIIQKKKSLFNKNMLELFLHKNKNEFINNKYTEHIVKKYIPVYYPVPVEHRITIPVKVPIKIQQRVLIPQAVPYGVRVPVPVPYAVEIPKYKEIKIEKPVYIKVPVYEHIPIYHHFAIGQIKKPTFSTNKKYIKNRKEIDHELNSQFQRFLKRI